MTTNVIDTHDEPQPDEEITTEDTESETESIPEQDEGGCGRIHRWTGVLL